MTEIGLRSIDQLLDELAALAGKNISEADFFDGFFDRLAASLPMVAAAAWSCQTGGQPRMEHRFSLPSEPTAGPHARPEDVKKAFETGFHCAPCSDSQTPDGSRTIESDAGNAHNRLLLLGQWKATESIRGVLEMILSASPGRERPINHARLTEALCELIADFQKNRLLRGLEDGQHQLGRYDQFLVEVHRSLDLETTAFTIANEGRHFVGCDRLTVLVRLRSRFRLLAMSGLDQIAARSNVVRLVESLGQSVGEANEPIWDVAQTADLSPQTEQRLNEYVDISHARDIVAVPLARAASGESSRGEVCCVLIAEHFLAVLDGQMRRRLQIVQDHCATALSNALEIRRMPLRRLSQGLRRMSELLRLPTISKAMAVFAITAAIVLAMAFVPADFSVESRGELQPVTRHEVFAPSDGIVSELLVSHGASVMKGQTLVVLRQPELEFEFKRVWGELQTAKKRLGAVQTERLSTRRGGAEERGGYDRLTAEEEEVNALIASLEAQHKILQERKAALTVQSPIDGEVLTWDVEQVLRGRPVARGQALLTVAEQAGEWELVLRIPDRRVAHVLRASQPADEPLDVKFILATSPEQQLEGRVKNIGVRSQTDEYGESFVLATAAIDAAAVESPVPGATVLAKIGCGRRSIGYVWFHDALDAVRRFVLF